MLASTTISKTVDAVKWTARNHGGRISLETTEKTFTGIRCEGKSRGRVALNPHRSIGAQVHNS